MGGAPVIEWIRPGVGFEPSAAASWRRAESDLGRWIRTNSTYRDYALQLRMYKAWNAYVAGTGPFPGHSRAIHPDFSKHCQGLGADSPEWTNAAFNVFMADRGWIRTAESDPTERHHYEYQWWRDNHRNRPAPSGGGSTTKPTEPAPKLPQEETEMIAVRITGTVDNQAVEHFAVLGPKVIRHFTSADDRDWQMRVIQPDDRWVEATLSNFPALAHSFGVARDAYKFFGGAMLVKEDGEYRAGGMWNG